jgi:hypothetical protein
METQIAIETSMIIKASSKTDSTQPGWLHLFIVSLEAIARDRKYALWVFRINSLLSWSYLTLLIYMTNLL